MQPWLPPLYLVGNFRHIFRVALDPHQLYLEQQQHCWFCEIVVECFSLGWGLERVGSTRHIAAILVVQSLDLLSKIRSDGWTQLIQHEPWILENILNQNLEIQLCIHLGPFIPCYD